jgi:hypothetical protein
MQLTVVGDSFCSNAFGWPQQLADLLGLELNCWGQGGAAWWTVRDYLQKQPDQARSSQVIVFVHTNADRLPTLDHSLVSFNHAAEPTTEAETAVKLYYKYIHNPEFLAWAQAAWFEEISKNYSCPVVVHLHSFPWSVDLPKSGINVTTCLAALSLNELGKTEFDLFADNRPNHFNSHNNAELAQQLFALVTNNYTGNHSLDHTKFEQRVLTWLDWR